MLSRLAVATRNMAVEKEERKKKRRGRDACFDYRRHRIARAVPRRRWKEREAPFNRRRFFRRFAR